MTTHQQMKRKEYLYAHPLDRHVAERVNTTAQCYRCGAVAKAHRMAEVGFGVYVCRECLRREQ